MKVYDVLGVRLVNVGDDCHEPLPTLYWQSETAVSVILVGVLLSIVGADGAVCSAFLTAAVLGDVTLPVQFADVTTTLI